MFQNVVDVYDTEEVFDLPSTMAKKIKD